MRLHIGNQVPDPWMKPTRQQKQNKGKSAFR